MNGRPKIVKEKADFANVRKQGRLTPLAHAACLCNDVRMQSRRFHSNEDSTRVPRRVFEDSILNFRDRETSIGNAVKDQLRMGSLLRETSLDFGALDFV